MPLCFLLIYAFLSSHDVAPLLSMLTNLSHAPLHFRLDNYQLFPHSLRLYVLVRFLGPIGIRHIVFKHVFLVVGFLSFIILGSPLPFFASV